MTHLRVHAAQAGLGMQVWHVAGNFAARASKRRWKLNATHFSIAWLSAMGRRSNFGSATSAALMFSQARLVILSACALLPFVKVCAARNTRGKSISMNSGPGRTSSKDISCS